MAEINDTQSFHSPEVFRFKVVMVLITRTNNKAQYLATRLSYHVLDSNISMATWGGIQTTIQGYIG